MRDILLILITLLGMGIGFFPMKMIGAFLEGGGFGHKTYRTHRILPQERRSSIRHA
jgi:hypothetical protein